MKFSRRSFLATVGAAVAHAAFAGAAPCPGGKACVKPRLAVQLYSIRHYLEAQKGAFPEVFAALRGFGYVGVEIQSNTYGLKAEEYGKIIADAGLVVCGSHCGVPFDDLDSLKHSCESNLKIGNRVLIRPGLKGGDLAEWTKRGEQFAAAAEVAASFGCRIGYHNHQHEFKTKFKRPDGTEVCAWQAFADAAGEKVVLEMDIGWATEAGEDPAFWFGRYPGRFLNIHAKETVGGIAKEVPEGRRRVDWDKAAACVAAAGTAWWVVETERVADTLDLVAGSAKVLAPYCA